jgi:ribosomal RNA-processing protein 17
MVDHEEEYLDEDKFTIVTIENVEVTKDGLEKQVEPVEHSASDDESKTTGTIEVEQSLGKARRIWTTEKPDRPKKKKKKFRYENKADRKLTRHKERAGSRAQAMARRQ